MFLPSDKIVPDHAVEHDRNARFANEEQIDQFRLVHPALTIPQKVQNVELRASETERLKEGFTAALKQALHEKEGDQKIVRFGLALHGVIITVNSMMSNYISCDLSHRIYPIRGLAGTFHLLYDATRHEAVLIDTGLVGEMPRLTRILHEIGLDWPDIKAILLTHGHLDHTGNLAHLKGLTGAPVLAHPLEQPHVDGTFPYRGAGRLCGFMEAIGRRLFRYRTVSIDQPLVPNAELPYWGGLRVIHLPGHTEGHCGFYSERFNLLFSGDLFASYWFSTHLPPFFLNSCPEKIEVSLRRVKSLAPRYIIPNHYTGLDGQLHRRRFDSLA